MLLHVSKLPSIVLPCRQFLYFSAAGSGLCYKGTGVKSSTEEPTDLQAAQIQNLLAAMRCVYVRRHGQGTACWASRDGRAEAERQSGQAQPGGPGWQRAGAHHWSYRSAHTLVFLHEKTFYACFCLPIIGLTLLLPCLPGAWFLCRNGTCSLHCVLLIVVICRDITQTASDLPKNILLMLVPTVVDTSKSTCISALL